MMTEVEELKATIKDLEKKWFESAMDAESETMSRLKWQERAEALERALKKHGGAQCPTCVHAKKHPLDEECSGGKCRGDTWNTFPNWKFDEARFSTVPNGDGSTS
jgi:hypothetical protein